jgi:diguanylate cyclase (GGDEF)-like protein
MSPFRHVLHGSVGSRIAIIALIPLAGFAANVYNYLASERQVASAMVDFERSATLSNASHGLSASLITMRSIAKSFAADPNQSLVMEFVVAHSAALKNVEVIDAAGDVNDRKDSGALRQQLSRVIDQLLHMKRALGLSETEDVRHQLAKTGAAVDRIINQGISWLPENAAKDLMFALLKMRYDEADYLVNRLSYTKDLFFRESEQVRRTVTSAAGTESQRREILQPFEAHVEAFREWSLAVEKLRPLLALNNADTEIMLPMAERIVRLAATRAAAASAALSESQKRTHVAILTVALAVVGFGLALTLLIGRGVTRPLTALANAMQQLASGKFDLTLPGLGRLDEIGSVAKAVETFKVKAIERAQTDALTGLGNRQGFLDRVRAAFAEAGRVDHPFVVLFLDLDQFKDVNDTLGHPVGDQLLVQVADRLKGCIRQTDFAARFGGDEFAVLQTNAADSAAAAALASKIGAALAAPYQIAGNAINVTASIGIARCQPDLSGPDAIMIQADQALYRAKENGGKCYCFHSRDLDEQVRERVTMTDELRGAIERGELELHYQPQVEIASGRVLGLEALLRWNHPTRGSVSPALFIPIAERSGSILPIGSWVFDEACRQYSTWQKQGIAPQLLGVNFSAVQFKNAAELEREIDKSLRRWSVEPRHIEIELTETMLMHVSEQYGDILERLRRKGLQIALDDFGTGYSSLTYLTAYPVNRLKIAQQLVFGVASDRRNATVVRAAIRLAHELGIDLIAEGIESAEQAKFLLSEGCEVAQGYHFSRPLDAASATELLRKRHINPASAPSPVRISAAKQHLNIATS